MTSNKTRPILAQLIDDRRDHFDALRLISAFAIIVSHYFALRDGSNIREPFQRLSGVRNLGKVVTYVCFVISGMAVTRSFLRDPRPGEYLIRRAARILPALWVSIAFCVVVVGLPLTGLSPMAYFRSGETIKFAANALLYPNHYSLPGVLTQFAPTDVRHAVNGSLWVFAPLFLMYLSIPVLGAFRLHCRPLVLLAIAVLMLAAWEVHALRPIAPTSRWFRYDVWFDFVPHLGFFFFCGASVAALRRPRVALSLGAFLLLLALVAFSFYLRRGQYLVLTLCIPYLTVYLSFVRLPLFGALDRGGVIALGVYLYGYPVQQLFMHTGWGARLPSVLQVLGPCAVCGVLALFSWIGVEIPSGMMARRIARTRAAGTR